MVQRQNIDSSPCVKSEPLSSPQILTDFSSLGKKPKKIYKIGLAMPVDKMMFTRTHLSILDLIENCDMTKVRDDSDREIHLQYLHNDGKPIDVSRNRLAESLLLSGNDWIFFIDSDQIFSFKTLDKLLSALEDHERIYNEEVKILGPVNYQAFPPFKLAMRTKIKDKYDYIYELKPMDSGLMEVDMLGTGVILIHKDVFLKIKDAGKAENGHWFEFWHDPVSRQLFGEDTIFCEKAKACGYKIYVDTVCQDVRHITPHGIGHEMYEYNLNKIKEIEKFRSRSVDLFHSQLEKAKKEAEELNKKHSADQDLSCR